MPDRSGNWRFPKETFTEFNPTNLLQGVNSVVDTAKQTTGKSQGSLGFLQNFVLGGQINRKDETGSFGITPGGRLSVGNSKGSFTVDPRQSSAGFEFPVGEGRIGIQGSWNKYNPSAELNFRFPANVQQSSTGPDFSGLDQWESNLPNRNTSYNDPTPQEALERQLLEYKSKDGRSPDSPSSWQW
jgi:hypothetical protein